MFEIDNPVTRATFLGKIGGVEEKVYMKIDEDLVQVVPEEDVDSDFCRGKGIICSIYSFQIK